MVHDQLRENANDSRAPTSVVCPAHDSRHQAPTALRIPLVASLTDDPVGEVAERSPGVSAPHD